MSQLMQRLEGRLAPPPKSKLTVSHDVAVKDHMLPDLHRPRVSMFSQKKIRQHIWSHFSLLFFLLHSSQAFCTPCADWERVGLVSAPSAAPESLVSSFIVKFG